MNLVKSFAPAALAATALGMSATPANAMVDLTGDIFDIQLVTPGITTDLGDHAEGTSFSYKNIFLNQLITIGQNSITIARLGNGISGGSEYVTSYDLTATDETSSLSGITGVTTTTTGYTGFQPGIYSSDIPSGVVGNVISVALGGVSFGAGSALTTTLVGSTTSAVPEPATWAMMLAGFGLVGVAIRRRPKMNVAVKNEGFAHS